MRNIIAVLALVILVAMGLYAQNTHRTPDFYILKTAQSPSSLTVYDRGNMVVKINQNGTIEYGADYKPDQAARAFWQTLSESVPLCRSTE